MAGEGDGGGEGSTCRGAVDSQKQRQGAGVNDWGRSPRADGYHQPPGSADPRDTEAQAYADEAKVWSWRFREPYKTPPHHMPKEVAAQEKRQLSPLQYQYPGHCSNERAFKVNGERHWLCDAHRNHQNILQRDRYRSNTRKKTSKKKEAKKTKKSTKRELSSTKSSKKFQREATSSVLVPDGHGYTADSSLRLDVRSDSNSGVHQTAVSTALPSASPLDVESVNQRLEPVTTMQCSQTPQKSATGFLVNLTTSCLLAMGLANTTAGVCLGTNCTSD
ncbi:hypothetical protein PHYPSEUDO_008861 [Phytophthora pseudosyringae]|uniref:Uncharacterized protein n=1 Tax=Phytophthora pseudosyringae TaxID=221518 RepID=A0A8T1VDR5_9STRA|nr:hypothetical protein PHYPSEUDO_008861 [Phytophthora pseudosyringae]